MHAQTTEPAATTGSLEVLARRTDITPPRSAEYGKVQQSLAHGWNTWDVNSVATQVLLPEGLAIHIGLKHNTTEFGDAFLQNPLIGRLEKGAEVVTPGPHSWDGSYTDLRIDWKGHSWRIQSAHDGDDLVLLVTPLPSPHASPLPPTVVFSVNFLWNRPGATLKHGNCHRDAHRAQDHSGVLRVPRITTRHRTIEVQNSRRRILSSPLIS